MSDFQFKRGQTVKILSRNDSSAGGWENTNVGGHGIVINSKKNKNNNSDYRDDNLYSLWVLFDDQNERRKNRMIKWFEEKFLELYCSNEERGLKILADNIHDIDE